MSINKMIAGSIGALLLLLLAPTAASGAPDTQSGLSYTATLAGQNVSDVRCTI